MKLYLIAGRARSGKTEVAKLLQELLIANQKKAVITEYSKYIKMFAHDLLSWDGISEPKPRDFLQEMGTYTREKFGQTFFTKRMQEDLKIYENFVDCVIISDVRMPQELDEMKNYNPVKIKVENDLANYDLNESQANHITEHALDNYDHFDYVIKNKSLTEIKEILKKIVEENER